MNEHTKYSEESAEKAVEYSNSVFEELRNFVNANDDIDDPLMMRTMSFSIGVWIAALHKHWFRDERHQTLRHYQDWMRSGMEEGVKEWME